MNLVFLDLPVCQGDMEPKETQDLLDHLVVITVFKSNYDPVCLCCSVSSMLTSVHCSPTGTPGYQGTPGGTGPPGVKGRAGPRGLPGMFFVLFFFKNSSWNNYLNIATIHITLADFNLTCCMFFSMQVALVLQAILAIQDLKATRVRMDFLDHLVKKEKQVRGIAGKLSK